MYDYGRKEINFHIQQQDVVEVFVSALQPTILAAMSELDLICDMAYSGFPTAAMNMCKLAHHYAKANELTRILLV